MMLNMKSLFSTVALLSCLFNHSTLHADSAIISGVDCKAANLQQALNLGMGHSQNGVSNNGAAPFFTVCPITTGDNDSRDFFNMLVKFPPGGGTMNCTLRGQANNGSFKFESININTGATITTQAIVVSPTFDPSFDSNMNLVCAMQPGSEIRWYILN